MRRLFSIWLPWGGHRRLTLLALAVVLLAAACSSGATATPTSPVESTRPPPTSTPTPAPPVPTATPAATPTPALAPTDEATPAVTPTPTVAPTDEATPAATPTPRQVGAALLARLKEIEQRVIGLRGLEPEEEPARRFVTREELQERFRKHAEEHAEEIAIGQEILTLLGLLEEGQDLLELQVSQLTDRVLGFFETDTGDLFVVGEAGDFGLVEEFTYAHEFVHALQQARFGLAALQKEREDDSEAQAALQALVEGDATLAQLAYAQRHMNINRLVRELDQLGDGDDEIPFVLRQSLIFPYIDGRDFVQTLFREGGWDAVDEAFRSPPVTTEQIMHPEKYRAGEAPLAVTLPDIPGGLGAGWKERDADVMGELSIQILLDAFLSERDADRAAAGWGGDRLVLLAGPDGQRLLVTLVRWDSEKDAKEFFDAYVQMLKRRDADIDEESEQVRGTTGQVLHLVRRQGDQTLWIVATDPRTADLVVALFPGL